MAQPSGSGRTCIFTSVTRQYTAKARILGQTLKQHHPDATLVLLSVGDLAEGHGALEPWDVVLPLTDLPLPDPRQLCFKYNVTELCTAVKPVAARHLMDAFGADRVLYLDPDIAVFDSLTPLENLLDSASILLTPHVLEPEVDQQCIVMGEVLFLKRGAFNLGFFGVRNDDTGRRFLSWWNDRLMDFCLDDAHEQHALQAHYALIGLFTDQKWIDLVPSLFDRHHIVRDPGYNVATWNLSHRAITRDTTGHWLVNGQPLRFFHFSGVDSGAHREVLDVVVEVNSSAALAYDISDWYLRRLAQEGDATYSDFPYTFATYDDGTPIPAAHRRLYALDRSARERFPDPFRVDGASCFRDWAVERLSPSGVAQATGRQARYLRLRRTWPISIVLRTRWLHRGLLRLAVFLGWR